MKTYADFAEGLSFRTRGLTVTEAHLVAFTGLSGDFHPLHTDEEYCRTTPFGSRIAHGPLVYSLALGLVSQANIFGETVIAFLGADRVRHLAPCHLGTTMHVEVAVTESRPTSDGGKGVITAAYAVKDQAGTSLMTADISFLVHAASDGVAAAHGQEA